MTKSTQPAQRRQDHYVKSCAACGRGIYRKSISEEAAAEMKYCSASCRRHKPAALDRKIEELVMRMLGEGGSVTDEEVKARFMEKEWSGRQEPGHIVLADAGDESAEQPLSRPDALVGTDRVETEASSAADHADEPARLRERTRQAARRLCNEGKVLIMQNKRTVDPSFAKGAFDIVLSRNG